MFYQAKWNSESRRDEISSILILQARRKISPRVHNTPGVSEFTFLTRNPRRAFNQSARRWLYVVHRARGPPAFHIFILFFFAPHVFSCLFFEIPRAGDPQPPPEVSSVRALKLSCVLRQVRNSLALLFRIHTYRHINARIHGHTYTRIPA